jgi:hypothetical protein
MEEMVSTLAKSAQGVQTKDTTQWKSKLGGVSAILIGLLNIVIVIYVVAATGAQRYDPIESITYFSENPLGLSVAWIVFSASAVLAYTVIPAVHDLVGARYRDWARAATIYGIVGFTVLGVWAITLTRTAPDLATRFVNGDEMTRTAVLAMWLPEIDPDGWFSFGGIGTWLIVMNVLALRGRRLPPWHALAGVVLGIGHWATVIAAATEFEPLNLFASGVGALLYPVWFIWLGILLLRGIALPAEGERP